MMGPKFRLGRLMWTIGADELFGMFRPAVVEALRRHSEGDWGDVCEEDKKLNDAALENGTRVLSAYTVADTRIWIITEADRSVTTILLPEEY
jgi:hypothetical protein